MNINLLYISCVASAGFVLVSSPLGYSYNRCRIGDPGGGGGGGSDKGSRVSVHVHPAVRCCPCRAPCTFPGPAHVTQPSLAVSSLGRPWGGQVPAGEFRQATICQTRMQILKMHAKEYLTLLLAVYTCYMGHSQRVMM